jgi:hypothetical protein
MGPEQKMILKVDSFMEQQRWDDALGYLDRFLAKHSSSLSGWRYRVLIRLEQGERALAAAEYHALNEALSRHEPQVLESVVLGSGGRWLLSDYRALARCAPAGLIDAAFFADVLEPKGLAEGSFTKVAIADDEIAAVIDSLPGGLDPRATWPLVVAQQGHTAAALRSRVVASAGRHLSGGGLGDAASAEALAAIQGAAGDSVDIVREAALLASLALPEGPGRADLVGGMVSDLLRSGDASRAVSLFLLGPGGGGPEAWSVGRLRDWSSAAVPLSTLARAGLYARGDDPSLSRALRGELSSGTTPVRLAVLVGSNADLDVSLTEVWLAFSLEDKRLWAPAFVRSGAADRGELALLALADKDGVLTQSIAGALALPSRGDDAAYEPALRAGLAAFDPATRAATAGAVVVRGAAALSGDLERLFASGQDRVMTEALGATLEHSSADWSVLVAAGLKADTAHIRELSVDAAAASCRAEDRDKMLGLLTDADPHVAVRAASALYLTVGQSAD